MGLLPQSNVPLKGAPSGKTNRAARALDLECRSGEYRRSNQPVSAETMTRRPSLWLADFRARPRSERLTLILLAVALVSGIGIIGGATVRFALTGESLGDLATYVRAARAIGAGQSPYDLSAINGPGYNEAIYRYPPVLASLLVPFAWAPFTLTGLVYSAALFGSLVGGLTLALAAGGWPPTRLRLAALTAICLWFTPVWGMLWATNTEGFQVLALGVSLYAGSGLLRGAASAIGPWLKVAPVLALPALFVRHGRRGLVGLIAASVVLVLPSLWLAPRAWADLLPVLSATAGGGLDIGWNLSPVAMAHAAGLSALEFPLRLALWSGAGALVAASVVVARKPAGWPAALACATTASLLLPTILWEHYLIVLLPFAAVAFPRASSGVRTALAYAVLLLAVADFIEGRELVFAAAALCAALVIRELWPRGVQSASVPGLQTGESQNANGVS
jgi:hypothetical protein